MANRANKIGERDQEFLESTSFLATGSLSLLVALAESINAHGDREQQLETILEVSTRIRKIKIQSLAKIEELRQREET